jgi:hypothetical protein
MQAIPGGWDEDVVIPHEENLALSAITPTLLGKSSLPAIELALRRARLLMLSKSSIAYFAVGSAPAT